jgi:hypothetical protein
VAGQVAREPAHRCALQATRSLYRRGDAGRNGQCESEWDKNRLMGHLKSFWKRMGWGKNIPKGEKVPYLKRFATRV